MTGPEASRHMSKERFVQYFDAGVALDIPIEGIPALSFVLRPSVGEVGLRSRRANIPKPLRRLPAAMSIRSVHVMGEAFTDVILTDPATFVEGFGFLCSVADRVQIDGMPLASALDLTIRNLRSLLAVGDSTLTKERELGYLGELLMMRSLLKQHGFEDATESWRSVLDPGAEHDFTLDDCEIEVKTTSGETRAHRISSFSQLVPNPGRDLWLISHQLTTAGSSSGSNLRDVADSILLGLQDSDERLAFESILSSLGWPWGKADLSRWMFRSETRAFAVCGSFPRITSDLLSSSVIEAARVKQLSYEIDLSHYSSEQPPPQSINSVLTNLGEL